jgi:hypothetical protein
VSSKSITDKAKISKKKQLQKEDYQKPCQMIYTQLALHYKFFIRDGRRSTDRSSHNTPTEIQLCKENCIAQKQIKIEENVD